jgi:uncharacterized protein (DUF427 family)
MADKLIKIPGPDHPISVEANPSRVVVKVGGKIIADTHDALTLREASYYSIPAGGDRSRNAVWTYETPFEAMAQIKDYVAFYPDRVDEIS